MGFTKVMKFSGEIQRILEDRETGSVGLLNRLIPALEEHLKSPGMDEESFLEMVKELRGELGHFAVIENFLVALKDQVGDQEPIQGRVQSFLNTYRTHWDDSTANIAENMLGCCDPKGRIILTHSHSETVIGLFKNMHERGIPFRVLQTVSSPGEEGRIAQERMHKIGISVDLIVDAMIDDVLEEVDIVICGCDALLETEFLNKTGTRYILEVAKQLKIPAILIAESRKKISEPGWKERVKKSALFEWVPLELVGKVVNEESSMGL